MSANVNNVAVLLTNLGTPDAPEPSAVRRYLAEFLSDPRVVEISPKIWKPVLYGVILRTRPAKSARAYREIWTDEGSPLMAISKRQAEALRNRYGDALCVGLAMRYGDASIGYALSKMVDHGFNRILVAPLYPQYCAATTASAMDAVAAELAAMRSQPAIRTLPPYFDDPLYIDALKASLDRQMAALDFTPERLLLSFHGMPERTRTLGDPYYEQCRATASLLAKKFALPIDVAFQSRFGRARWLQPATEAVLASYPAQGVKRIAIAAPGFSADCLETLEELGIRGRETFLHAGGSHFALIDCLNDSAEGMAMLDALIRRELAGWWPPA
ncbi:ferrochelatase [Sphingomonas sp. RB56-2]|uniref:Ferrochelatase n=1 Tax=Sphingomonas brevis TaxID=2908206 RepID=A0ABT0S9Z3_9SPHN|nr:ferrochelatase [Sphingomonas brevis]MCL6741226.1 ferrochelatase [Sphingomonas brevis]